MARVFPVSDGDGALALINVRPADAADFFDPHRGRHREAGHASGGNALAGIAIEKGGEVIQLVLGRASVPLGRFADEAKSGEGGARQFHLFGRGRNPMYRGSVSQNRIEEGEVDRERRGTGAAAGALAAIVDHTHATTSSTSRSRLNIQVRK